ncbi:hypothetical protein [Planococcus maritimus]|uniref:hypothetical protein n=1 Tax=Planococcus maritimus TaxID=192421 RepID=UPI00079301DC|nr:hypothetical protein [Planococcus maritimus]KYG58478.1 hypothetical protein AY633_09415 [Planococcus maritimus]
MGFTVNNLEDIKKSLQTIDHEPEFIALVLYKSEHDTFKNSFRRNFSNYHLQSGKQIHFFVFDNIVSRYTNKHTLSTTVNEKVVDTIKNKFNLKNKDLPAVILTKNVDYSEYAIVSFYDCQSNDEINEILEYIFEPFSFKENTHEVEYKINYIKNKWNNISFQSFSPDWMEFGLYSEKVSLRNKLLAALEEATLLLADLRDKLDAIQIEHDKLLSRKKEAMGILTEKDYSILTDQMFKVQKNLAVHLSENYEQNLENSDLVLNGLESDSIEMINSCLLLSKNLVSLGAKSFDYTLFVAGYWKALENELTIIVRDVLLYLKEYTNTIPYKENVVLKKTEDYNLSWKYKNNNKVVKIIKNNNVEDLTLGSAKLILQNYAKNDYGNLFIQKNSKNSLQKSFEEFIPKLSTLVKLRNDYSHKKIMNEVTYQKISRLVFDEKLLDKTIELKMIAKSLPSLSDDEKA